MRIIYRERKVDAAGKALVGTNVAKALASEDIGP